MVVDLLVLWEGMKEVNRLLELVGSIHLEV